MRPFQIILIGIFIALGFGGVLLFATFKGFQSSQNPYGNSVVIWGTIDAGAFTSVIDTLSQKDENLKVISYVKKDSRTFETELVNALAEGTGPDAVLLPQDMLLSQRGKINPIPFEQLPLRTFKDTYIDGAEIFVLHDGVYALPFAVDPLVMYWNRDTFASKGLSQPPRTWEELVAVTVPTIVEKTFTLDITRAAVAFGEYGNVRNAKDILALLFIQAGSPMITDTGNQFSVDLNRGSGQVLAPASAGLDFYTLFSNPGKNVYSWNRSINEDRTQFLSGDLALYFGFGSEASFLREGNPNFNFDIAEVPQGAEASIKKGFGRFYGLARLRNSPNPTGTLNALNTLLGKELTEQYARTFGLGPVYRSSYSSLPGDAFMAVIHRASLIARGWLDPNASVTGDVFRQMIEDVSSGRQTTVRAVGDAEQRLRQLLVN